MLELLNMLKEMIVPPMDAEHDKQYGWRLRMALVLFVTVIGLIGVTAMAFGLPPATWVGFNGFATSSDVKQIQQEIQSDRSERIEGELLQLRIMHCNAAPGAAKDLYWARISSLMVRYQQITGRVYTLPACTDL